MTSLYDPSPSTLVFLHYFGGAAVSWKELTEQLSSAYTCIAFDLPGFGQEPLTAPPAVSRYSDFVRKKIKKLGIRHYTLIGHSMGGKVAVQIAIDASGTSELQQLILLAPSPPTIERMPSTERARMLDRNEASEIETVRKATVKPLSHQVFERAVHTQQLIDPIAWRWWLTQGMNTPLSPASSTLQLPVTVVSSSDDPCITPEMVGNDVMPNLPAHSRLITLQGIGHLFPLEDPEGLSRQLAAILSADII